MVEVAKERILDGVTATGEKLQPGDMYFAPWLLENSFEAAGIADQHRGKIPVVVILPNGRSFCVHQKAYTSPAKYDDTIPHDDWAAKGWNGNGWSVEGSPPNLTTQPSINAEGSNANESSGNWHGWLIRGVLKLSPSIDPENP